MIKTKENGNMTKNSKYVSIQAKNPYFSIIIPVRNHTTYLKENLKRLKCMYDKSFEVIVITDSTSKTPNPAVKRNLGARKAKGKVLVFFDDDSYPNKDYFIQAKKIFESGTEVACGPQLTPETDSIYQKASGIFLSSFLGSGGAGYYRNNISKKRFVDDYPSVNFCTRKKLFLKLGGFDEKHWPGEDTLFCRKIIKSGHRILYTPKLVVNHHRRPIGLAFIKQHIRYGLHRGYFARIYPENSRKIGYVLPSLFSIYILFFIFFPKPLIAIPIFTYGLILLFQIFLDISSRKNLLSSILSAIFTPIIHIVYGICFIIGFFSKKLDFQAHKVDKKGNYIGG